MPRQMSPEVEREWRLILSYHNRPNPIDLYNAIRAALTPGAGGGATGGPEHSARRRTLKEFGQAVKSK